MGSDLVMPMQSVFTSLLVFWAAVAGFALGQTPPVDLLEEEIGELRVVVRTLDEANRRLEREKDELTGEIVRLRRIVEQREAALAEALAGGPGLPLPSPTPQPAPADATARPPGMGEVGLDVIYVNPTWHYIILSGGTDKGVVAGQEGRVLRAGNVVAGVKITSVKPSQCVADIDLDSIAQRGQYPRVGDAVVFP